MTIDPTTFRNGLGRFATGITIVTGISDDGSPVGVTVNAFSSLSLEPPLVLFCLGRKTFCLDAFTSGRGFALNVLSEPQRHLSETFSKPLDDRFEGVDHDFWDSGAPILDGCLANLECDLETVHDGGDHVIIIGRVVRLMQAEKGQPLLYFMGDYRCIGDCV
ncbi:MAG: flavin reductase family protein [Rhodospirillaceae bacterium]|nr:flavin reductase family protein [Rhodospirillaceae bacterium]MBT4463920.1 flavin reductase family protein [Rhodospirillaceae bacterium]MBT5014675.1 flavin reductase family protein [Rhodospirillaceae bacterium]MBT5308247.1 flavin reductase family protein [Rhodospirillaceae bacterium]MBT7354776.1 flavin reductase family protein [Rhodospirillaceae bacterium]